MSTPKGPIPAPGGKPEGPQPKPVRSDPKPMVRSKEDSALLNSPFAKMFRAAGAVPTLKQIKAIINGILMTQVRAIRKDEARWKKVIRKMKERMEGKE